GARARPRRDPGVRLSLGVVQPAPSLDRAAARAALRVRRGLERPAPPGARARARTVARARGLGVAAAPRAPARGRAAHRRLPRADADAPSVVSELDRAVPRPASRARLEHL